MSALPPLEPITTRRIPTQYEMAQKTALRLMDSINNATTRNTLDLYLAIIGGDALEVGRIILKIDRDLLNEQVLE